MPTPINLQSELDRHAAANARRVQDLVDQHYNAEVTRGFELLFTASTQSDAAGVGHLLFAKGFRLLSPTPTAGPDGTWILRVGVKRSLHEITGTDFVCDLVTLASGVHSCFQTWEFLPDSTVEQTQGHPETLAARGPSA